MSLNNITIVTKKLNVLSGSNLLILSFPFLLKTKKISTIGPSIMLLPPLKWPYEYSAQYTCTMTIQKSYIYKHVTSKLHQFFEKFYKNILAKNMYLLVPSHWDGICSFSLWFYGGSNHYHISHDSSLITLFVEEFVCNFQFSLFTL